MLQACSSAHSSIVGRGWRALTGFPQDTAGSRGKEAARFPAVRKALPVRTPKEKTLKPEKPKKENAKRGGPQPTAKAKLPAQQQTVVRGITYYKAGQVEEVQRAAGSRGECSGWGCEAAGTIPWVPTASADPTACPHREHCQGCGRA